MTLEPLQKAKALYNYYDDLLNKDFIFPIVHDNQLKQCALIAVNQVLDYMGSDRGYAYWVEVKKEIENL